MLLIRTHLEGERKIYYIIRGNHERKSYCIIRSLSDVKISCRMRVLGTSQRPAQFGKDVPLQNLRFYHHSMLKNLIKYGFQC